MKRPRSIVIVGATAMLLALAPAAAWACGGFFCNRQLPIDQSGEQIVFSIHERGVTAHIQIQFQGKAQDFAWVVPVMAKPTISLGTPALFLALLQRTQPQFTMDPGTVGQCSNGRQFAPGGGPVSGSGGPDTVTVVERREVGPYDTVILESRDAGELIRWLNANGYDQPPSSTPLIEHYVTSGMLFVALKLKQNAGAGEIQPIVLDMPHSEVCVPLVLTRVAAVADMPVRVFVLGDHRAFPTNWFHVEVNLKRIDWPSGGQNYSELVTEAINQAAGRGFVTEYAGSSDRFRRALWSEGRFNLEALRPLTDPIQLVNALASQGFMFDQTLMALLRNHIPMPASASARGVSEAGFYANIAAYRSDLAGVRVDTAAFIKELDERVVAPLREAQQMIDEQPYLTRLYATVSPDEMTRDPLFHFNPEMPTVSNVHTARAVGGTCQPDGTVEDLVLQLETGERFYAETPAAAPRWPLGPGVGAPLDPGPAAARIQLVGDSGQPTTYTAAQAKDIDRALDHERADVVRMRPLRSAGGGLFGCATAGHASETSALGLLAALSLIALRRARRRP